MVAVEMFRMISRPTWAFILCAGIGMVTLLGSPQEAYAEETGPTWSQLSKTEQAVLLPLAPHWAQLDVPRKQKWRDVATRFPQMSAEQQARARERMSDWSSMSIDERSAARLRFQESKQLSPDEREARWKAYMALPEDQRRALASKPAATARPSSSAAAPILKSSASSTLATAQPKSNLTLPPPATASAVLHPVSPGSVQATSGLSTRPITKRPEPPPHQQVGQPKITGAASAGGTSVR
jgi:hypothetical protein